MKTVHMSYKITVICFLLLTLVSCNDKQPSFEIINDNLNKELFNCAKAAKKAPEAYQDGQNIKLIVEKKTDKILIAIFNEKAVSPEGYIGTIRKNGYDIHLYTVTINGIEELIRVNYKMPYKFRYEDSYQEKFPCFLVYKDGELKAD